MVYIEASDYKEMSKKAANLIAAEVVINPSLVLGLATGSTPIGLYENLVRGYENGDLDFMNVKTVNLDEYVGLTPDNDQSYRHFMNCNLFDKVNIDKANTNVPNGLANDINTECERYDSLIESLGGIHLQLLGLGHNGHIGFNEPSDIFVKETHGVNLKQATIAANSRFFSSIDDVPKMAITMGMKSIMNAKKILLIVSGKDKEEILQKALYGPITPYVPASLLQIHPNLTVVASVK